jgi:ribose 5-phosphate isomerase B
MTEKIVLGADHAGFQLKEQIASHLRGKGFQIEDIGCYSEESVDYPAISVKLAETMKRLQEAEPTAGNVRGLLCCGSGIGVCISVNRFPWIRSVEAHDHNTVVMSRRHNDTNVLCLGGRVIAPTLAFDLIDTWLATAFEGGRHQKRVDMMTGISVESQGKPAKGNPEEIPAC